MGQGAAAYDASMTAPKQRRRGRRARTTGVDPAVARIVQPTFALPQYTVATEEQAALIHDVSLRILEEAGIAFYDEESLAILRRAGARVDDESVVRFDRAMVDDAIAATPSQFEQIARDPANNVILGGEHMVLAPVAGPPYIADLDGGRRNGTLADLINFVKMANVTPRLQHQGTEIVTPTDVPFHERALDIVYAHIRYGTKPMMGHYPIGMCADDSVAMARILYGDEVVANNVVLMGVINVSSPRRLDDRMLGTLKSYVRAGQALIVTPFVLAGAMGPAAILGTVAQANAEALATLTMAQAIRRGAPAVYGPFLASVDLQSGSPVMGSAESLLAQSLSAQMARRYDLPFRAAGGYVSSKVPDAQMGIETVMSMLPSMLSKPNFVLHAAGWMENGLVTSYEKFALDLELLGILLRLVQGVSWDEDEWALGSVLEEVPPGGHHLGTAHTMERFRNAFHRTDFFDHDSFEQWKAAGSRDAAQRANAAWKRLLEQWEDPGLDAAIDAELQDFMARRRTEIDPAEFQ